MFLNVVIGKPLVSPESLLALDQVDWECVEREQTMFTETRYLPAIMKEAGIVSSTNEVRKNKPEYNVTMDTKFELSFIDAMKLVLNGKFVQGENFVWNVYLAEKDGIVMINSFHGEDMLKYHADGKLFITNGVLSQKYREVSVLNESGLFHM